MGDQAKHPVRTTAKTLDIVEEMKGHDSVRVSELANRLDLGKSGVHNHLSTLRERGYVVKDGDEYRLGLKFLELGGITRKRMDLYEVAEPEVEKLADDTGELVNLMTEERGKGVYLTRSKGNQAVDIDTYAGHHVFLNCTALGKATLAYMPKDRVEEILDRHGLPNRTPNTITDRDELRDELETIREQGYALDDGERLDGLRCVAAPIKCNEDIAIAAISVSAPETRMSHGRLTDEVSERVLSAANVIELNMKY